MFEEQSALQVSCSDLLFFDRDLEKVVKFPYPMHNDALILPKGLKKYCKTRQIMWECWCGLYTSTPVFIQFYTELGWIFARCKTCGLDVCFNKNIIIPPSKLPTRAIRNSHICLMPMPSVTPPIRRDIDIAPHDHEEFRFHPATHNSSPPSVGSLLRGFRDNDIRSPSHRHHAVSSSPCPATGPSRFEGSFEDDTEEVREVCPRCAGAFAVGTFNDHICNPTARRAH
ncbi:hypothetical protein M422DRAFT_268359 [Sphaerobolus stellatus SS14]|uniref:Uncharacterized protein n=1 Tax=Sphaerobolus stellatus (strain SS14) TaxID=990650 RepID=A0A0C9UMQ9_SPHS4|nr:hypothetical protein M422DRAFT_268359 [Sphaerobolus stellatus SS14]